MAIDLVTITGTLDMPNGDVPSGGKVRFRLSGPDWSTPSIFLTKYSEVAVDAGDGTFSVDLQSTDGLTVGHVYTAIALYTDTATGYARELALGTFAVPAGGPYTLASLLAVPVIAPVPAGVLALATAQAVSALGQAAISTAQAVIATTKAGEASTSADLSEAWAAGTEPGGVGTKSALEWAGEASTSAVATAADRVQTGLDAVATAADRVQTGLDAVATAADRVQTGLDASNASIFADAAAATAAGLAGFDLAAIAESKGVTMVAGCISVFKMPLWLQMPTSWYGETLNTATRGSRQDMPTVLVVIATTSVITLYDGDDPTLPMWMVINGSALGRFLYDGYTADITSISAINRKLLVGVRTVSDTTGNFGGGVIFDFCADKSVKLAATSSNSNYGEKAGVRAVEWGAPATYRMSPLYRLVNGMVNDVAMTVLPGAPIDPRTGLAIPTIAVATDGGVSVIKDDGTVVDSFSTLPVYRVQFADTSLVWCPTSTPQGWWITDNVGTLLDGFTYTEYLQREDTSTGSYPQAIQAISSNLRYGFLGDKTLAMANYIPSAPYSNGFYVYKRGEAVAVNKNKGMIAKIQTTYNTGWMNGDIKGAFLSDTDTASLVASGELVTNGTFDTDTDWTKGTGWSIGGGAASFDAGTGAELIQTGFSFAAGTTYQIEFDMVQTSGAGFRFVVDTSGSFVSQYFASTARHKLVFSVSASSSRLRLGALGGAVFSIDNVSIKLADADRSVNNNGLIVNGTVTRSPVATGADLVSYSGWSA